ncbi:hypothetical protein TSAR_013377 [Trichomalopsis sarcophagae]|uniref:Uncharacterized protein n=1 Tax=Trichomalopsis sarcophagae TaxID=543379 RepID=A0A232ESE8_9HYME|nr:hypothetical protein TSAR_013377 [Trichomalopsis sarcophagae]
MIIVVGRERAHCRLARVSCYRLSGVPVEKSLSARASLQASLYCSVCTRVPKERPDAADADKGTPPRDK